MGLTEIISHKICDEGPLAFREFMEMCLYYPELGYYTSATEKIGVAGDYYTSPDVTPLFGAVIGRQIEQMWELTGKAAFTVVEYGAGNGKLCYDILNYLETNPQLYSRFSYYIIEKSPAMRQKAKIRLGEKVRWCDSIDEIASFTGCILSNELLDNFAVHQVVMQDELMEVFVGYDNGFIELLQPAAKDLKDYLRELNVELPKGFRTEINLQAVQWIREVASVLKKGYVITIDYGYPSSELYTSQKSSGTLICYNRHAVNNGPYSNIGLQDITSHVNFSALSHWGEKYGLSNYGLTTQASFLLGLGFTKFVRQSAAIEKDPIIAARKEAVLTSLMIMDMGMKFKVLVQGKGKIAKKPLLGLSL